MLDMTRAREVFEASQDFTVGIEEEFQILDPETRSLAHRFGELNAIAERVAEAMHESFPSAPMYTTVALPQSLPQRLRMADIRTSPLQHLPSIERRFRHYFMLYPFAVENFDTVHATLSADAAARMQRDGARIERDAEDVRFLARLPVRREGAEIGEIGPVMLDRRRGPMQLGVDAAVERDRAPRVK